MKSDTLLQQRLNWDLKVVCSQRTNIVVSKLMILIKFEVSACAEIALHLLLFVIGKIAT